jgi:hypothetical protein
VKDLAAFWALTGWKSRVPLQGVPRGDGGARCDLRQSGARLVRPEAPNLGNIPIIPKQNCLFIELDFNPARLLLIGTLEF